MTNDEILDLAEKFSEEVRTDGLFTYSYAFERDTDLLNFVNKLLLEHERDTGNPNAFTQSD